MLKIKRIALAAAIGATAILSGCATNYPVGGAFTDVTLPVQVTDENGTSSKQGTSSCVSYAAMVALGDCSIDAAKRDGGITEVHHMDWKANSILGIIGRYELTVYGD
ncbi:MAG: TRL-like family protein [Methylococcales bacterium]